MKKLLLFALLTILASTSIAGTMSTRKYIEPVAPWYPPAEIVESKPIVQPVMITNVVEKEKPKPSEGLFIGIHEIYPTVGYDFGNFTTEIGYNSVGSNQSGLLNVTCPVYKSEDKWTTLMLGASYYPGTTPLTGISVGAKINLTESAAITAYIYPYKAGGSGDPITSSSAIGFRLFI